MKKHQVVALVGTLALLANLLVPGMAFGAAQSAQQNITCPSGSGPTLARVPKNVLFTNVTPNLSGNQSSYDASTTAATTLPGGNLADGGIGAAADTHDHLLGVTDQRSGGIDGCSGGSGFMVSAQVTSTNSGGTRGLVHSNGTDIITADTVVIQTASDVALTHITVPAAPSQDATNKTYYADYTSHGALHDVGTADSTIYNGNAWRTAAAYANGLPLDTAHNVLGECSGHGAEHNSDFYTGLVLYINNGIGPTQVSGTYTGTITYTLNAAPSC